MLSNQFPSDSGYVTDDSLLIETPEPTETTTKATEATKDYTDDVNDYTRFEKEFKTLTNWNDALHQKMVIIHRELDIQIDVFNNLEKKVNSLPQQLEEMLQKHLKEINLEKYTQAVSDTISNKLSNIEGNIIPKPDQLKFYHDIQQCCTNIGKNLFLKLLKKYFL